MVAKLGFGSRGSSVRITSPRQYTKLTNFQAFMSVLKVGFLCSMPICVAEKMCQNVPFCNQNA